MEIEQIYDVDFPEGNGAEKLPITEPVQTAARDALGITEAIAASVTEMTEITNALDVRVTALEDMSGAAQGALGHYARRITSGLPVHFIFIGDSLTYGHSQSGRAPLPPPEAFAAVLNEWSGFGSNPVTVTNYGVDATGTTYALAHLDAWLNDAEANHPDAVFVCCYGGTNDLNGLVAEEYKDVSLFKSNHRTIIETIRTRGFPVVIKTPPPLLTFGQVANQGSCDGITAAASAVRENASELNVVLIEANEFWLRRISANVKPETELYDGIHFLPAGYYMDGLFMAMRMIMYPQALRHDSSIPSTHSSIRAFGSNLGSYPVAGSAWGWNRTATKIIIPLILTEASTDVFFSGPVWYGGGDTFTLKVNGNVNYSGTQKCAALSNYYAVDIPFRFGRNFLPGAYFIVAEASGGTVTGSLNGIVTKPGRPVLSSARGIVASARRWEDFSAKGLIDEGYNHLLSAIPLNAFVDDSIIEFTANFAKNTGFIINGFMQSDGTAAWGASTIFMHGNTGRLIAVSGNNFGNIVDIGAATDLSGVLRVWRVQTNKTTGVNTIWVDGNLWGTFTPALKEVRAGQFGVFVYDDVLTIKITNITTAE